MVARKFAAVVALLAALVVTQGQSIPTVVAPFQMFSPGPGPSVAIPAGAQACTIVDNLPPAYAFFTPQESNDTFTWTPLKTVGGGNITQPGVYVGSPSKLYFRPFLTQVNFPGVTGYELCGANALGLLAPVFPFQSTTLTNLTVTSLTATNVTTTNLTVDTLSGCLSAAAGVVSGAGGACVSTTPSPTASGAISISGTWPYTIFTSPSPSPLPSPTSANANCSFALVTLTCTTPSPLPSANILTNLVCTSNVVCSPNTGPTPSVAVTNRPSFTGGVGTDSNAGPANGWACGVANTTSCLITATTGTTTTTGLAFNTSTGCHALGDTFVQFQVNGTSLANIWCNGNVVINKGLETNCAASCYGEFFGSLSLQGPSFPISFGGDSSAVNCTLNNGATSTCDTTGAPIARPASTTACVAQVSHGSGDGYGAIGGVPISVSVGYPDSTHFNVFAKVQAMSNAQLFFNVVCN